MKLNLEINSRFEDMLFDLAELNIFKEYLPWCEAQYNCNADPSIHAHDDEHYDYFEQVVDAECNCPLQFVLV